eukprot:746122-Hanusia_phi.AAC.2
MQVSRANQAYTTSVRLNTTNSVPAPFADINTISLIHTDSNLRKECRPKVIGTRAEEIQEKSGADL